MLVFNQKLQELRAITIIVCFKLAQYSNLFSSISVGVKSFLAIGLQIKFGILVSYLLE